MALSEIERRMFKDLTPSEIKTYLSLNTMNRTIFRTSKVVIEGLKKAGVKKEVALELTEELLANPKIITEEGFLKDSLVNKLGVDTFNKIDKAILEKLNIF